LETAQDSHGGVEVGGGGAPRYRHLQHCLPQMLFIGTDRNDLKDALLS